MFEKWKTYNTICETDIVNLNVSIIVFKVKLRQENNQKMGNYIHYEIINDKEGNPKKIVLKLLSIKSFLIHFCVFIDTYSKNWEFTKLCAAKIREKKATVFLQSAKNKYSAPLVI